ncbi:uncharacterized protein [Rutidosis leptorrhynchoides]|uniref:uncharacterized protein n=1 Tax=Rutidosis leptorrhynchoides TaxID=125765 RepID=UPI003A9A38C4
MDPTKLVAQPINHIIHSVPIKLEIETSQYSSWSELFKIHCRAHNVLDHLTSEKPSTAKEDSTSTTSITQEQWERMDAIHSRALALENQFVDTRLDNYPNVSAYCQDLKMLSDQLANVDSTVEPHRLVLQLVAGLNDNYETIASQIQQSNRLPSFYEARSKLILEESRKNRQSTIAAAHQNSPPSLVTTTDATENQNNHSTGRENRNLPSNNGRGRGGRSGNRGGRGGRGRRRNNSSGNGYYFPGNNNSFPNPYYGPRPYNNSWAYQNSWAWTPQWNNNTPPPPCPYPTTPWTRPNGPSTSAGILGPRPQAHMAANNSGSNYTPMDIEQAMYTMSLNPLDNNWYMDTGASSHMTGSQGTLFPYFNSSINKNIIVGDGNTLPIHGHGHTTLPKPYPPLTLKNVLYTPHIIKNLISVCRLSIDNYISISFDPFGFTVKDFSTGIPIMRCDSTEDLYPLTPSALQQISSPIFFAAISEDLWHRRLGHPGANILRLLSNKKIINSCNKNSSLCESCVFGKHIRLPFYDSSSITYSPFDIIHGDV